MIINPIICENCKLELQPSFIQVDIENGDLIRICSLCGNRIKIEEKK